MLFRSLYVFVALLFASSTTLAAENSISTTVVGNGIGIGSALAIVICWSRTESVLSSIIAGFFGWLYVIYYLIVRDKNK